MEPGRLSSVIPSIPNSHGISPPECMESIDWPLLTRASWLRSLINILPRLINLPSFSSRIVGPAIQEGDGGSMTVKEIFITTRKLKNLVMNSLRKATYSMATIPPTAWEISVMELLGTKAV
jgi:hypothetical protein